MTTLGQRIRDLRLKKGITQIELSKGLVTPSMISQIESDRARPSYKVLYAIAERLEVPLEHVLKDIDLDLEYVSKHKMAVAMGKSGQYSVAIPLLEELISMADTSISKVELQYQLGICHMGVGDDEKALSQFEKVQEWAVFHNAHERLALVLMHMGQISVRNKDYQIGLYHSQRAIEELDKANEYDPMLHIKISAQVAEINQLMGKLDEAVKYYEWALSSMEPMNDLEAKTQMYLNLAQSYHKRGDFDKAEEIATKADVLLDELTDRQNFNEWHYQLSLLKMNKYNWQDTTLQLLNLAILYEQQSKKEDAGKIYADVAAIYLEHDEMDEAWALAEKAHLILPHNDVSMGKVNRVLAFVHFKLGDQEKGSKYLDNAITIFEKHGRLADYEEVIMHMCHYLSEKGRHREAFERVEQLHDFMLRKLNDKGVVLQ